jgi:putative ABC transport system substrate-binding protein
MNRRNTIFALAAFGASPLACYAQQQTGKIARIGFLSPYPASIAAPRAEAFRQGLRDLGWVEGRNIAVEYRYADGIYERLPGIAAELVELNVDVIVASPSPAIRAAQKATATIPIVMPGTGDPVGSGFVKSLARPGGNITGLALMSNDLSPKLLDLLRSLIPSLSRVAVLVNPSSSPNRAILDNARAAARRVGIDIVPLEANTAREIENGFSSMVQSRAQAVIVGQAWFFVLQQRQIAELASKYRLPSITGNREFAEAGGLMSYGQNIADHYRHAAVYVDKILKGAKPADLPVEQPTKFEMVVNLKAAKIIGLAVPPSLLARADEVIQ